MVKRINLPGIISKDLALVSEELSSVAKKPISEAMTISLLIAVYRAHMSEPCARDAFLQKIATSNFMSPDEFEKAWDFPTSKAKKKKLKQC